MVVGGAVVVVGAAELAEGVFGGDPVDPAAGTGPAGAVVDVEGAGLAGPTRGAVADRGRVVTAR